MRGEKVRGEDGEGTYTAMPTMPRLSRTAYQKRELREHVRRRTGEEGRTDLVVCLTMSKPRFSRVWKLSRLSTSTEEK